MRSFAKEIANKSGKRVRYLTKGTVCYLSQTCNSLVELSIYLLGTTHKYAILENITSDLFEKQFGKLRQGSGGTYVIAKP